jgi:hypothetical protein
LRKLKLVSVVLLVCLCKLTTAAPVCAQWADQRLAMFDGLMDREHQLAKLPHAATADRGAWGNIAALASRWPSARPAFARMALQAEPMENWEFDPAAVRASATGGSISSLNLANTRLSGFTQNETATAWCGGNVVVGFNDTGSEVNTFEGSGGVSAIGASTSGNKGSSYAYDGPPAPSNDVNQMIVGDPSLVCTGQSNFYYAATWWDGENVLTGVALAASTNGGKSYAQPVVAISKDGSRMKSSRIRSRSIRRIRAKCILPMLMTTTQARRAGSFLSRTQMLDIQSRGTQLSSCRHRTAGRSGMRQW